MSLYVFALLVFEVGGKRIENSNLSASDKRVNQGAAINRTCGIRRVADRRLSAHESSYAPTSHDAAHKKLAI